MIPFIVAWILACAAAFFLLLIVPVPTPKRHPCATAIAIATVARLVPLIVFRENGGFYNMDVEHFHTAAEEVLHWRDVYAASAVMPIYPYLPLQMYILALADWASQVCGVPFFVLVRIPHTLADIAIVALIFNASVRGGERTAFSNALLYAVCPLPILVCVYHGQFDSLSVFWTFLSALIVRERRSALALVAAGGCLGIGILEKTWPIFVLPIVLVHIRRTRARVIYAATAIGTPLSAIALYLALFRGSLALLILRTVHYRFFPNTYGSTLVLSKLSTVFPILTAVVDWTNRHSLEVLFGGVLLTVIAELPRRDLMAGILSVVIAVLTATTNGGAYHYLWLIPFALVAGQRVFLGLFALAAFTGGMLVAFVDGGIYVGRLLHPELSHLPAHWIVTATEWTLLCCWYLRNLFAALPQSLGEFVAGYRRAVFPSG